MAYERIRAGLYIYEGAYQIEKVPHAYTCIKHHKMRGGLRCPGDRPHFTHIWIVVSLATGEQERDYRSLKLAKGYVEHQMLAVKKEQETTRMSLIATYKQAATNSSERTYEELPEGRNNYKITGVKNADDKHGRSYLRIALESSDAKGSMLLYLEPTGNVEVWESVLGANMHGLGFDAAKYATDDQARLQFARFAPSLVGSVVDTRVIHKNGYVNVYFDGVVIPHAPNGADDLVSQAFDAEIVDDLDDLS